MSSWKKREQMYLVKKNINTTGKRFCSSKTTFPRLIWWVTFLQDKTKIIVVILLYFIPKHNICYQDSNDDIVSFSFFRNDIVASDIWMQS